MWLLKFHRSYLPNERRDAGKNGNIVNICENWTLQRTVWFAAFQQPEGAVAAGTMLWFGTGENQMKIRTS
jgi:hypothetical protein